MSANNGVAPEGGKAAPPGLSHGASYVEADCVDVEQLNAPRWLKASLKLLDIDGDGLERHEIEETLYLAAEQKKRAKENSGEIDYSNFPPKVREVLATWDADGSGTVGVAELSAAADAQKKLEKEGRLMKKFIVFLVLILVGLCVMNFVMSAVAVETGKDMKPAKTPSSRRRLLDEFYAGQAAVRRGLQASVVPDRAGSNKPSEGGLATQGSVFGGAIEQDTRVTSAPNDVVTYGYQAAADMYMASPSQFASQLRKINIPVAGGCAGLTAPFIAEDPEYNEATGCQTEKLRAADEKWLQFTSCGPKKPEDDHAHRRMLAQVLEGRKLEAHGKPRPPIIEFCAGKKCEVVPWANLQGRNPPKDMTSFGRKLMEDASDMFDLSDVKWEQRRLDGAAAAGGAGGGGGEPAGVVAPVGGSYADSFAAGDENAQAPGVPPPGTKRPRGGIYKVPEPDDKPDCPLQVKMEAEPQDQAPAPKDPPLSFDYFTPPGDQTGELGFVAFAAMQVSHGGPDDMPSCKEFVAFDADHNGEVSRHEMENPGMGFDAMLSTCQDTSEDVVKAAFQTLAADRRRRLQAVTKEMLTGNLGEGRRRLATLPAALPEKQDFENAKTQKKRRDENFREKVHVKDVVNQMKKTHKDIATMCANPDECTEAMKVEGGGKQYLSMEEYPAAIAALKPNAGAKKSKKTQAKAKKMELLAPGTTSVNLNDPNLMKKLNTRGSKAMKDMPATAMIEELAKFDTNGDGTLDAEEAAGPEPPSSDFDDLVEFAVGDLTSEGANTQESMGKKNAIPFADYAKFVDQTAPEHARTCAGPMMYMKDIDGSHSLSKEEHEADTWSLVQAGLEDHSYMAAGFADAMGYDANYADEMWDHLPTDATMSRNRRALSPVDAHAARISKKSNMRHHPRRIKASLGRVLKVLVDRPRQRRRMRRILRAEKKLVAGMKRKLGGEHAEEFQQWRTARRLTAQSRHRLARRMQAFQRGAVTEAEMHRHLEEHDEISDAVHKRDLASMRRLLSDKEDNHLRNRLRTLRARVLRSRRLMDEGDYGMPASYYGMPAASMPEVGDPGRPDMQDMMADFTDMTTPDAGATAMLGTGADPTEVYFDPNGGTDPLDYAFDSYMPEGAMDVGNFDYMGATEATDSGGYDVDTDMDSTSWNYDVYSNWYSGLDPDMQGPVEDIMEDWFATNDDGLYVDEIVRIGAKTLGCMGLSDMPDDMYPGDASAAFTTAAPPPMEFGDPNTVVDGDGNVMLAQNKTYRFDPSDPPPAVDAAVTSGNIGTIDPMSGEKNEYAPKGAPGPRRRTEASKRALKQKFERRLKQKLKGHYNKFSKLLGGRKGDKNLIRRRLDHDVFPEYDDAILGCPKNPDGTLAPPTEEDYNFLETISDLSTATAFMEQLDNSVPEPAAIEVNQEVAGGEADTAFLNANTDATSMGGYNDPDMNPYGRRLGAGCRRRQLLEEQVQRRIRRLRRRMLTEADAEKRKLSQDTMQALASMGDDLERFAETCNQQVLTGDELHKVFPDEQKLHSVCHDAAMHNQGLAENFIGNLYDLRRRLKLDEQEEDEHRRLMADFEVMGGEDAGCSDEIDCCMLTAADWMYGAHPAEYNQAMEDPMAQHAYDQGFGDYIAAPYHIEEQMYMYNDYMTESAYYPDPWDEEDSMYLEYGSGFWDATAPETSGDFAEDTDWDIAGFEDPTSWGDGSSDFDFTSGDAGSGDSAFFTAAFTASGSGDFTAAGGTAVGGVRRLSTWRRYLMSDGSDAPDGYKGPCGHVYESMKPATRKEGALPAAGLRRKLRQLGAKNSPVTELAGLSAAQFDKIKSKKPRAAGVKPAAAKNDESGAPMTKRPAKVKIPLATAMQKAMDDPNIAPCAKLDPKLGRKLPKADKDTGRFDFTDPMALVTAASADYNMPGADAVQGCKECFSQAAMGITMVATFDKLKNTDAMKNKKECHRAVTKKLLHLVAKGGDGDGPGRRSLSSKGRRRKARSRRASVAKKLRKLRMRFGDVRRLHVLDARVILQDVKVERERRRVLLRQRRKLSKDDREAFDKHHGVDMEKTAEKGKKSGKRILRRLTGSIAATPVDLIPGDDGKLYTSGADGMPVYHSEQVDVYANIGDTMDLMYSDDFAAATGSEFNGAEEFGPEAFYMPPAECTQANALDTDCICYGAGDDNCHQPDAFEQEVAAMGNDMPDFGDACVECPTMHEMSEPHDPEVGPMEDVGACVAPGTCEEMKDMYMMDQHPMSMMEMDYLCGEGDFECHIPEGDLERDSPLDSLINFATAAHAGAGQAMAGSGAQEGRVATLDMVNEAIAAAASDPDVDPARVQEWEEVANMMHYMSPEPENFHLNEHDYEDVVDSHAFNTMNVVDGTVGVGDIMAGLALRGVPPEEGLEAFHHAERAGGDRCTEQEYHHMVNTIRPQDAQYPESDRRKKREELWHHPDQRAKNQKKKDNGRLTERLENNMDRMHSERRRRQRRLAMRKLREEPVRRKLRESGNPLAYMEHPQLRKLEGHEEHGVTTYEDGHMGDMYGPDMHYDMPDEWHHYWEPEDHYNTMDYAVDDPHGYAEIEATMNTHQYPVHEAEEWRDAMSSFKSEYEHQISDVQDMCAGHYLEHSSAILDYSNDMAAYQVEQEALGGTASATWEDTYSYSGEFATDPAIHTYHEYQNEMSGLASDMAFYESAYTAFDSVVTTANTTDYAAGGARSGRRLAPTTADPATTTLPTSFKESCASAVHNAMHQEPAPISSDYTIGIMDCCDPATGECFCGPHSDAYVAHDGTFDVGDMEVGAPDVFHEAAESASQIWDDWGGPGDSGSHEVPEEYRTAAVMPYGSMPHEYHSRRLLEALRNGRSGSAYPRRRTMERIQKGARSNRLGISLITEFAVNWDAVKKHRTSDPDGKARLLHSGGVAFSTMPNADAQVSAHDMAFMFEGTFPWESPPAVHEAALHTCHEHGNEARHAVDKAKNEAVHAAGNPDDMYEGSTAPVDPYMMRAEAEQELHDAEAHAESGDDPTMRMDHMDNQHMLTGLHMDGPVPERLGPDFDCDAFGPSKLSVYEDSDNDGSYGDETGGAITQLDFGKMCEQTRAAQDQIEIAHDIAMIAGDEDAAAGAVCRLRRRLLRRLAIEKKQVHPHVRQLAGIPHEFFDSFTGEVIRSRRLDELSAALQANLDVTLEPVGENHFTCGANGAVTYVDPVDGSDHEFAGAARWGSDGYDPAYFNPERKRRRLHMEHPTMVAVNAMLAGDHIPKDQKKILKETKAAFQLDRKVKQFEMMKDGAAFNKAFSNPALGGKLIRDFADSLQEGYKRAGEAASPFANIHPPADLPDTHTDTTDTLPADGIADKFQMFHAYQDAQTYLPNPIGQEMLRGVASGNTDFDLLKKIAAPKCLDDAGNSPQNPVAQKKMDDKIKMATDKHGGNDCYDFCAGVMVYWDHKSEGISDTLPVDPRPTAEKCDCSALQTCGDGAAMKTAYNAEVKRLRVRRMRQRRRLVQAERRRQLKETPERKLTLRELEADMWFERGVEFLLPAEKVAKSRRKLQARRAKNFFRRNLKKKTRHTARRNRVFTGKKKAGRRNLKQRLALP